jgi:hypothetical protein
MVVGIITFRRSQVAMVILFIASLTEETTVEVQLGTDIRLGSMWSEGIQEKHSSMTMREAPVQFQL